jgi:[ribosomal protein S5]-alanine N-acetyltransferase
MEVKMLKLKMPMVETERLILRPVQLDDAKDMYEYCSDDDVIKYLWFEKHDSVEYSQYIIEKLFLNRKDVGIPEAYAIVVKENNKMIGTIDVNQVHFNDVGVIGYVIHKDYWGKGFVTEALETLILVLFNYCGFYRLEINHCVDNVGSAKVIDKAGFIQEGRFRRRKKERDGHRADYVYYGLCKDDEIVKERYGEEIYEKTIGKQIQS